MRCLHVGLVALTLALTASVAHAADAPFLTTIGPGFGTGVAPSAIAYSPDGTLVATTNHDANTLTIIKLQDDGSPRQDAPVSYPTGKGPSAVAFSPNGHMLAVTNEVDGTVSMFLIGTGAAAGVLTSAGQARPVGANPVSVAFSANSRFLATANRGGGSAPLYSVSPAGTLSPLDLQSGYLGGARTVRFSSRNVLVVGVDYPSPFYYFFQLDPATGKLMPTGRYGINDADLCDGQFSPDGLKFAYSNCYRDYDTVGVFTIGEDGTPGSLIGRVFLYPAKVTALAWSPDGSLLATANAPGFRSRPEPAPTDVPTDSVSMLSVTSNSVSIIGDATPAGTSPSALTFSPDRGHLVVANAGAGGFSMFRVARRGRLIPSGAPVVAPAGEPTAVAFSADGLVVGTAADTFTLSDDGQLGVVPDAPLDADTAHDAVAFSPSGRLMARVDAQATSVTLTSVSPTGALTFKSYLYLGFEAKAVAFSPDGTLLAIADATGIYMLTVSDDAVPAYATYTTWPDAAPVDLAFRPGGMTLTAVDGRDRLITFSYKSDGSWSLPAITSLSVEPGSHHSLVAVAYSPDGSRLAAADEDTNQLWLYPIAGDAALAPDSATVTVMADTPTDLAFSPTTDTVVAGMYSGLAAYAMEDGGLRRLADPSGGYGARRLAISPDGRYVVGTQQNTIATWSLAAPWLEAFIDSGPAPVGPSTDAHLVFTANYPARLECQRDDAAYVPCTSPWPMPGLADGAHTASVRARDLSGVLRGAPATWTWTTDDHGPHVPDLAAPISGAANLPPTGQAFTWKTTTDAISAIDRYELWIDQGKAATLTAAQCSAMTCQATVPAPLADGAHTWTIKAYDTVDHVTETAPRAFTVDATPPSAPQLAGPDADAFVAEAQPLLSWVRSDDGGGAGVSGYDVVVDGRTAATVEATATSWVPASALAEGPHTWQVVATDRIGNRSASAARSLTIDQTPPMAALRISPSRFVPPFRVTLNASASTDPGGAIARYEFDLDGDGAFETPSAGPRVETTLTTLGDHRLGVRVVDRVGRVGVATETAVGEGVESKGPKEASVTIDDGAGFTRDRTVSLTIEPPPHSGAVTMIVSNDGRPDQALRRPVAKQVSNWSLATGDGLRDRRIVYVVFYNAAGLQVTNGRVSDDILYDPYAPTVRAAVLRLTGTRTGKLTFRAKDRGSGLQRWQLKSGRRVLAQHTRFSGAQRVTLPKRRVGTLRLVLRDRAGNTTRTNVQVLRSAA